MCAPHILRRMSEKIVRVSGRRQSIPEGSRRPPCCFQAVPGLYESLWAVTSIWTLQPWLVEAFQERGGMGVPSSWSISAGESFALLAVAPVAGATVRRKSKQRTASFSDLSDFSKSPTLKCLFPRVVVGVGRRFNNNDCLYLKHYKLKGGRSFSI